MRNFLKKSYKSPCFSFRNVIIDILEDILSFLCAEKERKRFRKTNADVRKKKEFLNQSQTKHIIIH